MASNGGGAGNGEDEHDANDDGTDGMADTPMSVMTISIRTKTITTTIAEHRLMPSALDP